MIYGVILAGGNGSRMGNVDRAKPFLMLGNKPIIIHTIEKFCINQQFEKIIVPCPKQWINHAKDLINKYLVREKNIFIVEGGETRNESIMNSIRYIKANDGLDDETIIITHDSVRPFVTNRILEDNIRMVREKGSCDTVVPATDTIIESNNKSTINNIPKRERMYHGQTPQSFRAKKLLEVYETLSNDEKSILTDAAKIMIMKGEPVYLVDGEIFNIKITWPYDLKIAEALLVDEDA